MPAGIMKVFAYAFVMRVLAACGTFPADVEGGTAVGPVRDAADALGLVGCEVIGKVYLWPRSGQPTVLLNATRKGTLSLCHVTVWPEHYRVLPPHALLLRVIGIIVC